MYYARIILLAIVSSINLHSQILINEIMSSNTRTLEDNQGDFPDWVELINTGSEPVNLVNYYLTDKRSNLTKWTFPELASSSSKCDRNI